MKTLTLISASLVQPDPASLAEMGRSDRYPRFPLYQIVLGSDMLDEHYIERIPAIRRFFYKALPTSVAQVLEVFVILT